MNGFISIAKIRKNELEIAESNLLKINIKIEDLKNEILQKQDEISRNALPASGTSGMFALLQERAKFNRNKLKEMFLKLENLKNELIRADCEYKNCNIEMEKMKHIIKITRDKKLKMENLAAQKRLDEISVNLYFRNKQNRE